MWEEHVSRINTVKHLIELTSKDTRPFRSAPYRAGLIARQLAAKEKKKMFQEEAIEPVNKEWANQIVFACKTDGSLRFYVDYCNST